MRQAALRLAFALLIAPLGARAQAPTLHEAIAAQRAPLMATLEELVSIESGSRDAAGLKRISEAIARRLADVGGSVAILDPVADDLRPDEPPAGKGRMVRAVFTGQGRGRVLLIAHMDTVYPQGALAKEPFRVEGDRAYGLGITDDKQGVGVIVHALAVLRAVGFRDYGAITVLVNGDEEIGSRGSRSTIRRLAAEHDATLSFEASPASSDRVSLATAGTGVVTMTVRGRASHAGNAPDAGVNALYELSHQILRTRDLSDPATGTKVNWTAARVENRSNVIPAEAHATADVRVNRIEDYETLERALQERVRTKLLPEAQVELRLRRGRPPLQPTAASAALAEHARGIYREIGRDLLVSRIAEGGGTDAAYAAAGTNAPVIERMGLRGAGSHGGNEYVALDSIEPRLYLAARLIMDIGLGKVPKR